jgi:hypothetical protein
VQSVGGRTALPAPRRVNHPPFVQWKAPLVWTTVEVVLHADGRRQASLTGASPFPRHWQYGDDGKLEAKAGLADFKEWFRQQIGPALRASFEQRECIGGVGVLAEHHDADRWALVPERERGAHALVGPGGRHPYVGHDDVGGLAGRRLHEVAVAAAGGDHLDAVLVVEQLHDALAHEEVVVGDNDAQRHGRKR